MRLSTDAQLAHIYPHYFLPFMGILVPFTADGPSQSTLFVLGWRSVPLVPMENRTKAAWQAYT